MQVTLIPWPRRKSDRRSFWWIHQGMGGASSAMPVSLSVGKISVMTCRTEGVGLQGAQRCRHLAHHGRPPADRVVAMVGDLARLAGVGRVVEHHAVAAGERLRECLLGVHVDAGLQGQDARILPFGPGEERLQPGGGLGARRAVQGPYAESPRLDKFVDDGIALPAGGTGHGDDGQAGDRALRGAGRARLRADPQHGVDQAPVLRLDRLLGEPDGCVPVHARAPALDDSISSFLDPHVRSACPARRARPCRSRRPPAPPPCARHRDS